MVVGVHDGHMSNGMNLTIATRDAWMVTADTHEFGTTRVGTLVEWFTSEDNAQAAAATYTARPNRYSNIRVEHTPAGV